MTESTLTQANREVGISCADFDDDVLLFRRMRGVEAINQLFRYEVEVLSERDDITAEELLGKNATVRVSTRGEDERYWNGFVASVDIVPPIGDLSRYVLTLRPWLWFLTRTANSQIFQKDVDGITDTTDIIKKIFRDRGFSSEFEDDLNPQNYRQWEFLLQYRETDFNFVSRLMEHEGIHYYFTHENGSHKLVMSDPDSTPQPFGDYATVLYYPETEGIRTEDHFSQCNTRSSLLTGEYEITSRDWKNPATSLKRTATTQRSHDSADFKYYVPEGGYFEPADADRYVQIRLDEIESQYQILSAGGNVRGMCAGSSMTLDGHPRADQNKEYRILQVEHNLSSNAYETITKGDETSYSCSIEAIDVQTTYRPRRVTPKPEISGPITAVVAGPDDEEITVDEHLRVPVRFHFDPSDRVDQTASCMIRVSQAQAGRQSGWISIPRKGEEVIVNFIEGDPDNPIITGRVFNGDNQPPYPLPENRTYTVFKSLSTPDGGGFNELRFDDKKDEEKIYIHGQKDFELRVLNDRKETIDNDRHLLVKNDKKEKIDNESHEEVVNNRFIKVGVDNNTHVVGNDVTTVEGNVSLTVEGDVDEGIEGRQAKQVTGDYHVKAENIVLEALTKITIKVGQSWFVIDSDGLTMNTNADITTDGSNITMTATTAAEMSGSTAKVNGDSTAEITGGTVNIN